MGRSTKSNRAARLHAIATEMGVDPELVAAVGKGIRSDDDIKSAVQAHLDGKADSAAPSDEEPKPKKERKASLTLSQRRALLRLLDSEQPIRPATAFKALPYEHLVEVGYAVLDENSDESGIGEYTLTEAGRTRASTINPGYAVWSAGETVAGDPNRPTAGTKRSSEPEGGESDTGESDEDPATPSDEEPKAETPKPELVEA